MQLGSGRRPGKRWSSWYDEELVVQDGEDILSRLDNWAIVTLRAHRLVWSGWGAETYVPVRRMPPKLGRLTYRTVSGIDLQRLRLFFLSLLWRAAATTRPEFAEIVLPAADLDKLGRMVIENNSTPVDFYPMALVQLSTRGPPHNLGPIAEQKPIPNLPGLGHQNRPFFRFYLDGLIAHVDRQASADIRELGPFIIGNGESLFVHTIPYERSWQLRNLIHVMSESLPRHSSSSNPRS
jgi:hypothetical protein